MEQIGNESENERSEERVMWMPPFSHSPSPPFLSELSSGIRAICVLKRRDVVQ